MFSATFRLLILFTLVLILPLRAQDDPNLIDVTALDQLYAIRFDLNGDGMVMVTTAAAITDLSNCESFGFRGSFG